MTKAQAIKEAASETLPLIINEQTGTVKNLLANYTAILSGNPYFSRLFRFNLFNNQVDVAGGVAWWNLEPHPLGEIDKNRVREMLGQLYMIDNEKHTRAAILSAAWDRAYNPIIDRLDALKWDGVPRTGTILHKWLGADISPLNEAITKLLFYGLVQRIRNPGCKFDFCVTFQGGQGAGKSTFCRYLAIDDKYFCDNMTDLNDSDKVYRKLRNTIVVEFAEMLATRRARDVETIKSVISATQDNYTEKYETNPQTVPRHTVFIGTTNSREFLPADVTGNRRFLPVFCDATKAEKHPAECEQECRADVLQAIAEADEVGRREGWTLVLDKRFSEEIETLQEQSTPADSRQGIIEYWLEDHRPDWICIKQLMCEALGMDVKDNNAFIESDLAAILDNKIPNYCRYNPPGVKDCRHTFPAPYGKQKGWCRVDQPRPDTV